MPIFSIIETRFDLFKYLLRNWVTTLFYSFWPLITEIASKFHVLTLVELKVVAVLSITWLLWFMERLVFRHLWIIYWWLFLLKSVLHVYWLSHKWILCCEKHYFTLISIGDHSWITLDLLSYAIACLLDLSLFWVLISLGSEAILVN